MSRSLTPGLTSRKAADGQRGLLQQFQVRVLPRSPCDERGHVVVAPDPRGHAGHADLANEGPDHHPAAGRAQPDAEVEAGQTKVSHRMFDGGPVNPACSTARSR